MFSIVAPELVTASENGEKLFVYVFPEMYAGFVLNIIFITTPHTITENMCMAYRIYP